MDPLHINLHICCLLRPHRHRLRQLRRKTICHRFRRLCRKTINCCLYLLWFSTKWLHTDARRTAAGLDESLQWCLENSISKTGVDGHSRLSLFDENVLQLNESHLVKQKISDLVQGPNVTGDHGSTEMKNCDQSDYEMFSQFDHVRCSFAWRKHNLCIQLQLLLPSQKKGLGFVFQACFQCTF